MMICLFCLTARARQGKPVYRQEDSIRIVSLLKEAAAMREKPKSWMLWLGKRFIGTPYVGGTLDRTQEEVLVVNTRQLDCTTYVEMLTAMTMCIRKKETSFEAFCRHLRHVRYVGGKVEYTKRQHYFTLWIEDNEQEGIVKEIQENPPFTAIQTIQVDWMTTHQHHYKMLNAHPEWVKGIRQLEESINGKRYRYIPKANIANSELFRKTIHDGDIIVIVTRKKGLDTTHVGIASWHGDGLHLLNASSIRKKVVDEPLLLKSYMARQPNQTGIRVCRVLADN